ncbi:hypothetical protein EDD37DRAFT_255781 [Exophiala viscosa]|uniref:Uncharacterized protein n=1 Tax=Exophiala viscosa TaxID=2486360 RepID=A0AAN6E5Y8_9EURO|nr:hypothetical protein EDD36DRAFT_21869 [Exophiala viscosa]KAI1627216.1 hypothetical protein EDD37DRAFT_255781 [Exophiala viscosa]
MSSSAGNPPSVVVNTSNNRQQVPLRDYLNARVAPFLKKAITQSLDVEAEFPLQWLGECLIHQSILYEGNPDRTNIRERFLYTFEDPKPQDDSVPAPPSAPSESAEVPQEASAQAHSDAPMDETRATAADPIVVTQEVGTEPEVPIPADAPVANGIKEEADTKESEVQRDGDTEMGGTV